MKRLLCFLMGLGLAGTLARADTPVFITPDVPTTETATSTTLLPWQIFRYDAGPLYTLELTVPGTPHVDAIHKMDDPGDWLISVEAPNNLGGALTTDALPGDVVHYDGATGTYSLFFCGGALGIPLESNVDALYMEGGDAGNLVVSFDVPTELPPGSGTYYDPADLVRFLPTGAAGCAAWVLSALNPAFDASATGAGIPTTDNLIGADARFAGPMLKTILSMDVPSDLAPTLGPTTYTAGNLAVWDGANFDLFEPLAGWPPGSLVDGVSCQANPGRLEAQILLGKAPGFPPDIFIVWPASCSDGADDYGIYEGTLASVRLGIYDHVAIDCNDAPPLLQETIAPPAVVNSYYLVVPYNLKDEGSYGLATITGERPQPAVVANRCTALQNLTPCPP